MSSYDAILIDLDGTIIDIGQTFRSIFSELRLPVRSFDATANYLAGVDMTKLLSYLLIDSSVTLEEARVKFYEYYAHNMQEHLVYYPGALETLNRLTEAGITWGIVSNKKHQWCEALVKICKLNPAVVLGAGVIPQIKPHPAPLIHAAQIINVHPSRCCYVGDMPTDLRAAAMACMDGIYASYGCYHYIDPHFKHTMTLKSFPQLLTLIPTLSSV